jgi:putative nucleotidyltransferase with HDIG domain
MNIRQEIVSKVTSFPTLPVMAQRLLSMVNDPDVNFSEMTNIIQHDPALTANVLKAANSAFLGFDRPVESLSAASLRIGTRWIFQIAVSSLTYSKLRVPAEGYGLSGEDLWRHSLAVALMAENLCSLLGIKESGPIFTGALVHDMGKIALGEFVSGEYDNIRRAVEEDNLSFEQAEAKILGVDHAEIGAKIAENWHFPEPIIDIIRWHHSPEAAAEPAIGIDIVHVADAVCLMQGLGIGRDELRYRVENNSISRLNLSNNIIETATSQVVISLNSFEEMFVDKQVPHQVGR